MKKYNPILSEKPKDLEGALEWAQQELEKEKRRKAAEERILEKIHPLIQELEAKKD